jgi:hypothetical protein
LRRSSVSGGKDSRITLPSFEGVMPRSLAMIAFSIEPIAFLSNGCTSRVRGSGTENDASCWSGTWVP